MDHLSSMLTVLLIAVGILMAGILISRGANQSLRSAFSESLAWGAGCLLSFSAEILVLAYI